MYRGIGFSTWMEICGLAPSRAVGPSGVGLQAGFYESAIVRVHASGSVTDRVMAAMDKAAELGGDRRCTCDSEPLANAPCTGKVSHVAYILAADAKDPLGQHSGSPPDDRVQPWNGGGYALFITVTPPTTPPGTPP